MKKNHLNLIAAILCILLILIQIAALCGYWYSDGSALGLLSAVILLCIFLYRYYHDRSL